MDELATADFLGMRRKYADVIAQNTDYQSALRMLQDKIDELEGQKEEVQESKKAARNRVDEKGVQTQHATIECGIPNDSKQPKFIRAIRFHAIPCWWRPTRRNVITNSSISQ